MHDLDRTQAEADMESAEPESDSYELELEGDITSGAWRSGRVFDEVEEMELANELLEIHDEAELEEFLGKLIKKAAKGVGKFMSSPTGKMLGGVLKGAAKKLLPIAGGALGTFVGGPAGAMIGSNLAGMAGKAMGLELEGLSQEDQEFEVARQFVRFAGEAAKNTAAASPSTPPAAAANAGTVAAARKHAPGLLRPSEGTTSGGRRRGNRSGRWIRRGSNIILIGA